MDNEPLSKELDDAVVACVAALIGEVGYKVTMDGDTCDTLEKITDYAKNNGGKLLIWGGASDKTIFGAAWVNWAFRAWHDYHHVNSALPFTPEGEKQVAQLQMADLQNVLGDSETTRELQRIIWAEVAGQLAYETRHGVFPTDQRGFITAYLSAPAIAVELGAYH